MKQLNQGLKYFLLLLMAALLLSLLQRWVSFSSTYNERHAKLPQQPQFVSTQTAEPLSLKENIVDSPSVDFPEISGGHNPTSIPVDIEERHDPLNRFVVVTTDTIKVTIDKSGGDIVEVSLLKHASSQKDGAAPLRLLEKNSQRNYIAKSGLIGPSGTNANWATAVFYSEKLRYDLTEDVLVVDLFFRDPDGISLTKRFSFSRGSHLIDVRYFVKNDTSALWRAAFYAQINRDNSPDPSADGAGFGMQSFLGAATTTTEEPYKKIPFNKIQKEPLREKQQGGWIAVLQHYFVSAWIPNQEGSYTYYSKKTSNGDNAVGFFASPLEISPGEKASIGAQFYAGPKNQYRLKEIAENLDLTVDYGWLWWLAQPLYALLHLFATGKLYFFGEMYQLFPGFGNWGFAIIMLTVVVKALFFNLSATSYRSMANMRRVQPKLLAIRERHANDKQEQSKAMMALYQKEKINPLGGCLPILIQMPVFIALYWALMESVELRHAPFIGWIKDLSAMDPYFVLPIMMGATMWFQQKLNPPPPDPMQAKVMQWMPIIFTFFFLFFPAGLVVYWVSNNILSIAQQWVITRQIENAANNG